MSEDDGFLFKIILITTLNTYIINIGPPSSSVILSPGEKARTFFSVNRSTTIVWFDPDERLKYFPELKLYQSKNMASILWSAIRIIHSSFLESNQSITAGVSYQQLDEVLIRLIDEIQFLFRRIFGHIMAGSSPTWDSRL